MRILFHKLPRLYLPQQYTTGTIIEIGKEYSHRLSNVLRMRQGDHFRVFNGTTGEYLCEIEEIERRHVAVRARVLELLRPLTPAEIMSTLYFSPIKKTRQKILIEKATELGAQHFVPVISQNTNHKFAASDWITTAVAATEQADRMWLPIFHDSINLKNITYNTPLLICRERSNSTVPIMSALRSILSQHNSVGVLVGPEGGFTEQECEILAQHTHAIHVTLGDTILRAETASIYALSCIGAVHQQLKYENPP